jgi:AcrR family transcriptional regulator
MNETVDPARKSIGARRNPDAAEAILEAAEAVLLERGYAGFSIEAVARRARAGKPTVYRWWSSKTALLLDVYQRQKRDIDYGGSGPIEDDMFRFLRSLFRFWRDTPGGSIFRSLLAEAQSDDVAGAALADYAHERLLEIGVMVERARERGEVAEDVDPVAVADLLASYAWKHLLTNRIDEDEATTRAAARMIARGILKAPPR